MKFATFKKTLLVVGATFICSQLVSCATTGSVAPPPGASPYNVLVLPTKDHPWAAPQISAALADHVKYFSGSFVQAIEEAKQGGVNGILVIKLDTSSLWETGRVDCYSPSGKHLWHDKVFFNMGGGAESIAHKFADELTEHAQGKHCGVPLT